MRNRCHHTGVPASRMRWVLPSVAALVLAVVGSDAIRRIAAHPHPVTVPPADTTRLGGGAPAPGADSSLTGSHREQVRGRIVAETPLTYIAETVAGADSAVRRWPDDRIQRPLRV